MQLGTTALVIAGLLLAGCGDARQGNATAGADFNSTALAAVSENDTPAGKECNSWKSADLLSMVQIQQFSEKYLPENIPYKMNKANQLQIGSNYHGGKCYVQFALRGMIEGTSYNLTGECEVDDMGVDNAGQKMVKYLKVDTCTRLG